MAENADLDWGLASETLYNKKEGEASLMKVDNFNVSRFSTLKLKNVM